MDHGRIAAIAQTHRVISDKITARTLTPTAEDAPVMFHDQVLV
jgi:hypothetical protein